MKRLPGTRLAAILAGLGLWVLAGSSAVAYEAGLSVPKSESDPVRLTLAAEHSLQDGLDAPEVLQVFTGTAENCCENRTPVAGDYVLNGSVLEFRPAFGFATGQAYVVRAVTNEGERIAPFALQGHLSTLVAAVTGLYPSGDVLPENALRFYIHFSRPMTPHVAFDYIKLRKASGEVDEAAFMRFKQELWNEDRTRLTVLIDPGRIKRNVATNIELGPALVEGQSYTFSVGGGWPSADGTSVLPGFSKTFTVGPALRERPNILNWQITSPCLGTRNALEIAFDRPFDRSQLQHSISVVTADGKALTGTVEVGEEETSWRFKPAKPWPDSEMVLTVHALLEDVAGNNFSDLLDHTVSEKAVDLPDTTRPIRARSCSG